MRTLREPLRRGRSAGASAATARGARRLAARPSACGRCSKRSRATSRWSTDPVRADVVHAHTWYTHLAGVLAQQAYGIPLVADGPLARAAATVEARAARRRIRRQQLGRADGHRVGRRGRRRQPGHARGRAAPLRRAPRSGCTSSTTASTPDFYRPDRATAASSGTASTRSRAVRPVRRAHHAAEGDRPPRRAPSTTSTRASASSSAPASRTRPRSAARWPQASRAAQAERPNVVWIGEMVSREDVRQLYSHAAVFCCPSVYEPFGIINLEAAACETPVVASAVGRHPRGRRRRGDRAAGAGRAVASTTRCGPIDPDRFERDLAGAINALMADPHPGVMGRAARRRAVQHFSWGVDRPPDGGPLPHDDRLAGQARLCTNCSPLDPAVGSGSIGAHGRNPQPSDRRAGRTDHRP